MLRAPGPQVADTPDSSHAWQGMQTPGEGHHLTRTVPRPGPCGHVHCPTVPRGQERTDTWSVGGGGARRSEAPQMPVIFTAFSFFFFFSFHPTSIVSVVVVLLKRNHVRSWFSADTGTRGGTRQTQTCDRQATVGRPGSKHRVCPVTPAAALHCSGATGAPEQWKCTFCHLPSRRCHTRVSSDWLVRGRPCPSMYCVRRM